MGEMFDSEIRRSNFEYWWRIRDLERKFRHKTTSELQKGLGQAEHRLEVFTAWLPRIPERDYLKHYAEAAIIGFRTTARKIRDELGYRADTGELFPGAKV